MGKKKSTKASGKKKCCDKPLRKMCKRCPRRRGLAGNSSGG